MICTSVATSVPNVIEELEKYGGSVLQEVEGNAEQRGKISAATEIWDWEKASAVWEAREYMEKWAQIIQIRNAMFMPIKTRNVAFLSFRKLN